MDAHLDTSVPNPIKLTDVTINGERRRFVDVDDLIAWLTTSIDRLSKEGRSVVNELIRKLDAMQLPPEEYPRDE